jgi:hypothetical protein
MAINPAGSPLGNPLATLEQALNDLGGLVKPQAPAQQQPAATFEGAAKPPVNLAGGQQGGADALLNAVTGILNLLTEIVKLLGLGGGNQAGGQPGAGGQPAAGGGAAGGPAAGGGTAGAPAAGGGTAGAPAAGGTAGAGAGAASAAAAASATVAGPNVIDLGNKGLMDGKTFGINGGGNQKKFDKAMGELATARPIVTPAAAGAAAAGPGKLNLTADQVAQIMNAGSDAEAAALVKKFMGGQGTADIAGLKGGDWNSWQKKGNSREALNNMLGVKIPNGRNKNKASELLLNQMSTDIARSIRGGAGSTTTVSAAAAAAASGASSSSGSSATDPYASGSGSGSAGSGASSASSSASASTTSTTGAVCVDLSQYKSIAQILAEMGTPLIFDLTGTGTLIREGEMVPVELDGDGRLEVVTDLAFGTGLLVFDPKLGSQHPMKWATGAEMFGSGTDLSAYGITAPTEDGTFENGFDALRALAERFNLVGGQKQHLDSSDLSFLESKVGLMMRVGGLFGGDVSLRELGITRLDLGDPNQIETLDQAQTDTFGNKYMRQVGARFMIRGQIREYVDIFFRIQARITLDNPAEQLAALAA